MTASPSGHLATARDHLSTVRKRLSIALETSRLVGAAGTVEATLGRWGGDSRLVRWFLVEPDPEVVVVDLRETYIVGPPLRLVRRAGGRTRRLAERSGLAAMASTTTSHVEAAPLRWLGAVVATIALLGAIAGAVGSGQAGSDEVGGWLLALGAALLATRERRSAAELAETGLGRALAAAFEPPDDPGRDDG